MEHIYQTIKEIHTGREIRNKYPEKIAAALDELIRNPGCEIHVKNDSSVTVEERKND